MTGIAINRKTGEKKVVSMTEQAMRSALFGRNEGVCPAADGCRVELDGECSHGWPSKMLTLGGI